MLGELHRLMFKKKGEMKAMEADREGEKMERGMKKRKKTKRKMGKRK